MSRELAQSWLDAVAQEAVCTELETIYEQTAHAVASHGPVCKSSGRCCNFESYGHRLFVTGLEAAYAWRGGGVATADEIGAARARGGCPFQVDKLCRIHAIKPLGCRVYYCDQSELGWQEDLSEQMLGRIRSMHERWGIEYRYGEWRSMLDLLAAGA